MLSSLALAVVLAAPASPGAGVQPISVQVETAPRAAADVQAWAGELRSAVLARKDEFRATRPGEKPELVVRLLELAPLPGGRFVLGWEVERARQKKPFSFTYSGELRPQVEKLARNLRALTEPLAAPKK